ncbi:hypothetical protein V2J09_002768 [Rumex salicifolius]
MKMGDYGFQFALKLLQRACLAVGFFIFAIGGGFIGSIVGSMKGQTTETGFSRGAAIGIISGAIVALEILDSVIHGHFLSKVALFGSILNGKAFREWVGPAILKAYLWQTSMLENSSSVARDIYDMDDTRGLSLEIVTKLPVVYFHGDQVHSMVDNAVSCTICLQDLVEDERVRILPKCEHMFHVACIDEWLVRNASCPVCRNQVEY